ncbi:MAG: YigZ family protein [Sulfuricurvum sp.]|uniref:YigZ family protein n=1 Tax=Sulfuricurvum sp. TaxID=2025608 RepID=UPI0026233D1D|nr:YigZ family protein [Sulfuricurvum sp.]MDD2829317.1 YigZ family protein [Sulfuricurvum sp.]MDD4948634.1 YigZ family protein [Sulfuricurvum sp.]
MVSIGEIFSDSIEIKGSKFISFLIPMSQYEVQMEYLRMHHPKAVHFVSAFRYLNEFDQIVEHAGDDGEPKGTSGKPTLSVLQGHELINVAIITVRYFGGTKLGPGGLVRAYAEAANAAYAQAQLLPYEKLFIQKIECNYSNVSMVEYECTQKNIRILSKVFGEIGAIFEIEGTEYDLNQLIVVLGRCIRRIDV